MSEQRSTQQSLHRHHWQLNPDIIFLNHGSFGATPTVVLEQQQHFRAALESEPIQFLAPERKLEPKLDRVREIVATQVHCCLLYTSPSPRDLSTSRMPSSA